MTAPLAALTGGRPAVVTGQQAGLFGGPLFTIAKLLGAVALAGKSGATPLFWVECDDADVVEVDRVTLADGVGELHPLALGMADDGRPVGARHLGPEVEKLLAQAADLLPAGERSEAALGALRAAYLPGRRWPEAFVAYLESLVAGRGVVFLDPTAPAVKAAAAPFFATVIARAAAVEEAVAKGARLVDPPQVVHVAGELPLFVLDEAGRRRKLERRGDDGFALKGSDTRLGRGELEALLAAAPERFSAAVLLRPVLQDWLLPTTAYLAGPAEARYHAQLGPLYELLEVARPQVLPRPRLVVVEARPRRALDKLGATLADALQGETALLARAAARRPGVLPLEVTGAAVARIQATLDELRRELTPIEAGAGKAIDDAARSVAHHLDKAARRAEDHRLRADQEAVAQARKALAFLLPGGQPQERVFPPLQFLARLEAKEMVERVLAAIDPADPGRLVVLDVAG